MGLRERKYHEALEIALDYMQNEDGYLSSLKQAWTDVGGAYGNGMEKFVRWAEKELFVD